MDVVSKTRRGLATEVKLRCHKCKFEKSIWTEHVSKQLPIDLSSAAITGTIGIRNGLSAIEEFLDVLNVPSVSLNTTYAEKNKVPAKATGTEDQSDMKQEDAAADEFTVVVKGKWMENKLEAPKLKACLEKQPGAAGSPSSTKPVPLSDMFVMVNPGQLLGLVRTQKSPDKIVPDIEPGPSKRIKLSSSTKMQDAHMEMAFDNYPANLADTELLKVEEQDNFHSSDDPGVKCLSSEESSISNQKGSLFHPPVLIKEEAVEFEES